MYPIARPSAHEQLRESTVRVLREAKRHPIPGRRLQKEIARSIESFRAATLLSLLDELAASGSVTILPGGAEPEYFWTGNLTFLKERLRALVESHHRANPYDPGMKIGDIKKRFAETRTMNAQRNIDPRLFDLALTECKQAGHVVEAASGVRLPSFVPKVRSQDELQQLDDFVLSRVDEGFCVVLDVDDLARRFQVSVTIVSKTITRMVNDGVLLRLARHYPVKEYRYLRMATVERAKSLLARELTVRSRMSTSEMRVALGQTRSTTIPLLEYLDSIGFTRRDGDHRLLVQPVRGNATDDGRKDEDAAQCSEGAGKAAGGGV